MGKGMPDHSRYLYVYLPSNDYRQRWNEAAKKKNLALSKFVIDCVEKAIGKGFTHKSREDIRKARELAEENAHLQEDNKMLRMLIEKLETELKYYRTKPFLEERFRGVRSYEKDLIELLSKRGLVSSEEILQTLKIDTKDMKLVRAVTAQLRNLESYGLIEETVGGWRWKK
ncbi:MAG: hypothetical protein QMD21_06855 [Candidatus Thermoplasmatota archaeon]|nr:hypothetical protein [Candidatus Thermoplasmatota archaeon]